jgi:hypothetical protein
VRDKKIEYSFYRQLPRDYKPSDLIFVDELIECSQTDAPKYPIEGEIVINSI